jgi:hypothetical protein
MRKLKEGVIKGVCQLMASTEVPELFSLWGGIVAVSAVLGRHCFIDQGHFTVYPNLYVVLVAGSAKCRKSTMVEIVNDLVDALDEPLNKLSQKCTPEALIGALSGSAVEGETRIVSNSTGIAIVDELSTLIDKHSFGSGLISVLTKLYDCKDFEYRTRSRGVEKIRNPCLSIFGGSTLHWIKECIPIVSVGGGFTARIVFIFQDKRKQDVPWPVRTSEEIELFEDIVNDLDIIRKKLRGRFGVSKEAKDLYCKEYIRFCKNSPLFQDANMSGYAGRRHAMVLKLAMCFSASMRNSKEIQPEDIQNAIIALKRAEKDMPQILSEISSTPHGDIANELVQFLAAKGRIYRSELKKRFLRRIPGDQLELIMKDLEEAKYVKATRNKSMKRRDFIKGIGAFFAGLAVPRIPIAAPVANPLGVDTVITEALLSNVTAKNVYVALSTEEPIKEGELTWDQYVPGSGYKRIEAANKNWEKVTFTVKGGLDKW